MVQALSNFSGPGFQTPVVPQTLVDAHGRPLRSASMNARLDVARREVMQLRRQLRAKYDAAQTATGNQNHWANADNLDPHAANSFTVRRKLRSRSRYEVIENNPFLKGTLLTIANDFVGRGPRLQITDKRLSKDRRRAIEERFQEWSAKIRLRQKLWRMRMAKITDGEAFAFAFNNRRLRYPLQLDFNIYEADQVSSEALTDAYSTSKAGVNEIDGIRFDGFNQPLSYHLLKQHPGSSFLTSFFRDGTDGTWIDEKFCVHWFRQDRGWLRGIPETTPSLPLCALLRRYTLAVVRHKEIAADFSAILETEGPPTNTAWTDGQGNLLEDDPFDVFPIEMGMITTMPWGYKMKQLESVPDGIQYDSFVGSILREIVRPLLATYNVAVGTSKDSNMASAVVDQNIYNGGQEVERQDCNEVVLDRILWSWWMEAVRMDAYLGDNFLATDPQFRIDTPKHAWRWDQISPDHTDPAKVANALKVLHDKRFITDRDVQEIRFNRNVEDWREEVLEDEEFRKELTPMEGEENPAQDPEEADDQDAKEERENAGNE